MKQYLICTSEATHRQVNEARSEFKISMKEYADYALSFFYKRGLNPMTYNPNTDFETVQFVKNGTDQIIKFIRIQEENLLGPLVKEVIRTRLLQEGQLNLLIEKSGKSEGEKQRMQKDIWEYVNRSLEELSKQ